jgi:hypothetical protein
MFLSQQTFRIVGLVGLLTFRVLQVFYHSLDQWQFVGGTSEENQNNMFTTFM